MRSPPIIALTLALLPALTGCAVRSTLHLVQAQAAVERAGDRGAEEHAAYEYTLATRYLEKAREASRRNQHRTAEELARAAAGYADQAVIRMQEMGLGTEEGAAREALPEAEPPPEPEAAPPLEPEPEPPLEPEPTPEPEPAPVPEEEPAPEAPTGGTPW